MFITYKKSWNKQKMLYAYFSQKKHIHNMMDDKLLVQTLPLSLNASTQHFRPELFIVILGQFTNNVLSTRLTVST